MTVEVHPPGEPAPVMLRARVVRRFDLPLATSGGAEPPAGMGVELVDPAAAFESLRPIVERIERRLQLQRG